uniref:Uncharacterized protein LOC111110491 n=1 Tax=Crassostrea virginica TaxID=6565 RepID=A0A8B8BIQ8_CRAVI|nr:uncharacterized protein LOC111110491 [Crassostrea virginica]
MSARGGQWVAAGVLVVVGVGIILYLTKKRKKTDPVSKPDAEKKQDVKSVDYSDQKTQKDGSEIKTSSQTLNESPIIEEETTLKTNEERRLNDEKKTTIPVPKSLGKLDSQNAVNEKPMTAEKSSVVASQAQQSTHSNLKNESQSEKNNPAVSPDRQCERLEKTVPPESEKTISINVPVSGKTAASQNTIENKSNTPTEKPPLESLVVTAGPVLSPSTTKSPPGATSEFKPLTTGPVLSPVGGPPTSKPTPKEFPKQAPTQTPKPAQDSVSQPTKYSTEEITEALLLSQNSPGMLSTKNVDVLVSVLQHPDPSLRLEALLGVNKCSTFTRNQNLLREHGCLIQLSQLLRQQVQNLSNMSHNASAGGDDTEKSKMSEKFMNLLATAINNLSANEQNHKQFEECVPMLVDVALEEETGESVRLSSLQALTNLSVMEHHHNHYTRIIQKLYDFLDGQNSGIRLQAAKILVNLSCNPELVPHMLAAKAPACVLELLRTGAEENLVLRWTTFLANILHTVKESHLSASSLPPDDKAPSPETMYSALYGMNSIGQIKSKVFLLCRHRNEDIKHQASRIYQTLNAK